LSFTPFHTSECSNICAPCEVFWWCCVKDTCQRWHVTHVNEPEILVKTERETSCFLLGSPVKKEQPYTLRCCGCHGSGRRSDTTMFIDPAENEKADNEDGKLSGEITPRVRCQVCSGGGTDWWSYSVNPLKESHGCVCGPAHHQRLLSLSLSLSFSRFNAERI